MYTYVAQQIQKSLKNSPKARRKDMCFWHFLLLRIHMQWIVLWNSTSIILSVKMHHFLLDVGPERREDDYSAFTFHFSWCKSKVDSRERRTKICLYVILRQLCDILILFFSLVQKFISLSPTFILRCYEM